MNDIERLALVSRQVTAPSGSSRLNPRTRRKSRNGMLIIGLIGFAVVVVAIFIQWVPGVFSAVTPARPEVTISTKYKDVFFENRDGRTVEIEAAINNDFRQNISLAPGESKHLPTRDFMDSRGTKFDVDTMKPLRMDMKVHTPDGGELSDHRDLTAD